MPQKPPAPFLQSQRILARGMRAAGQKDEDIKAELRSVAEKCGYLDWEDDYVEYGGAVSFDEYDSFLAAQDVNSATMMLHMAFQGICDNILDREDISLAEKARLTEIAARDFGKRLGSPDLAMSDMGAMKEAAPGLLTKARSWLGGKSAAQTSSPATPPPPPGHEPAPGMFRSYKDSDGGWRWFAVYSNHFKDADGEWFPYHAHKAFADAIDARTVAMPELWLWHVPGSRAGVADVVDLTSEGFMVAGGTFDRGKEAVAEALAADPDLGVSHGFEFDTRAFVDGAYNRYWTYEISPLPHGKAANKLTSFAGTEVSGMFTAEKKAWLGAHGMDATVLDTIEKGLEGIAAKATANGVSFKELTEAFTIAPVAPPPAKTKDGADESGGAGVAAPSFDIAALVAGVSDALKPQFDELRAGMAQTEAEVKALKAATPATNWTPRVVQGGYQATLEDGKEGGEVPAAVKEGLERGPGADAPAHIRTHLDMARQFGIG